ncbi:MAG: hypothetical protein ABSH25_20040 [Syntrophorhabdales bacterium]
MLHHRATAEDAHQFARLLQVRSQALVLYAVLAEDLVRHEERIGIDPYRIHPRSFDSPERPHEGLVFGHIVGHFSQIDAFPPHLIALFVKGDHARP